MARPFATTAESRLAVIRFAREHGTAAAAERMGVTARTIRNWIAETEQRVLDEIDATIKTYAPETVPAPEPSPAEPPKLTAPPVPPLRDPGDMPVVHVGAPMRPLPVLPRRVALDELFEYYKYAAADLLTRGEHDEGAREMFREVHAGVRDLVYATALARQIELHYGEVYQTRSEAEGIPGDTRQPEVICTAGEGEAD